MKEEFDFDKVGKRMPYKVPADFFDTITAQTLTAAETRSAGQKVHTFDMWRVLAVAASVVILVTAGYFMYIGSLQQESTKGAVAVSTETARTDAPDTILIPASAQPAASQKKPHIAAVPEPPKATEQQQPQQPAQADKPETLEEILAGISDEELLQLAAIAKSDLYVYEQTPD